MAAGAYIRFFLMQDYDNSIYYYWNGTAVSTITSTTIATSATVSLAQMPAPINWTDTEIKWARNTTYYGVFRSLSTEFKFTKEASAILNYLYLTQGIQAVCSLRIQIRDDINDWTYNDLYVSNIDFSKYNSGYYLDDSPDQSSQTGYVSVNTLDSQLSELLNAYADTTYNIPMYNQDLTPQTDPDAEFVYTDGTLLTAQYNFTSAQGGQGGQTISTSIGTVPTATTNWALPVLANIAPQSQYFGNEVLQNNLVIGGQTGESNTTIVWEKANWALKALSFSGSYLQAYLTGSVAIAAPLTTDGAVFTAAILGISSDDVIRSITYIYQKTLNVISFPSDNRIDFADPTGAGGTAPNIYYDATSPLNVWITSNPVLTTLPDGMVYLLGFNISQAGTSGGWSYYFEDITNTPDFVKLNMGGGVQYPPSATMAFRYYKVWEKLVPLMTSIQGNFGFPVPAIGTPYTASSSFLSNNFIEKYDNKPYYTFLTSGNALRDFPNYKYITTSVSDFFNDASRRWSMGLGIEGNNLRLEPLSYFFDGTTMIADLTEEAITNLTIEPFTQYSGSNIIVGYSGQSFNEYGTLDDYNLSLFFRLPITRILNQIDWTCPYNASIYEIEKARADQQANNTNVDPTDTVISDSHTDNEVYVLEGSSTSTSFDGHTCWELQRYAWTTTTGTPSSFPSVSGLQYPSTAFNIGLTPKRNLLRNGALLHSICHLLDSNSILFQSASPTGRLLTDKLASYLDSGLITEYDDVAVSSLATPLYLPILVKFDSPQPINLFSLLNSNPRGYIKFAWNGNIYKGFIWEAGIHPGNQSLFSFQLLLTPDTDLSTLQFLASA